MYDKRTILYRQVETEVKKHFPGKVFETNGKITERENLAVAICPGNFTDVKQTTEHLGKMLREEGHTAEGVGIPQRQLSELLESIAHHKLPEKILRCEVRERGIEQL